MAFLFPGGLSQESFLADYWQKKPLLCQAALGDPLRPITTLLTPQTLAGLACEDDVEARLILSQGPAERWQLRHGPFEEEDFTSLPATDWSLLVQDVDKFIPQVGNLLAHFSFLPSWRIDDVMVSFAAPGGTVGPHIDSYDVFLLQGAGTRRWEIGHSNGSWHRDAAFPVLKNFEPTQTFDLKTGDALYLPPGIAHFGHSEEACMTLSMGFRTPSVSELIMAEAEQRASHAIGRYSDQSITPDEIDGGKISEAAVARAIRLLGRNAIRPTDFDWFGCLVTENKDWLVPEAPVKIEDREQFLQDLQRGRILSRHSAVRFARCDLPEPGRLFVDGAMLPLTKTSHKTAVLLCRDDHLSARNDGDEVSLLYNLYCAGKLYWADEQ